MTEPLPNESASPAAIAKTRLINWTSLIFALLQSACTAVIAISGIRVAIGVGAIAAAAGSDLPARGFHSDAIRIPMMVLALAGACINLYVIGRIRRLRARPASQWRQEDVPASKLRAERIQISLAIITLLLLLAEAVTHPMLHHVH